MSTIPIQTLIIDNDTDIGLSSDLINGNFKTSSLTDYLKMYILEYLIYQVIKIQQ